MASIITIRASVIMTSVDTKVDTKSKDEVTEDADTLVKADTDEKDDDKGDD